MTSVSQAGAILLKRLATEPGLQLRRTTRGRFYLLTPGDQWSRSEPVNQQTAKALHRAGLIEQGEQTGQDLPHSADRAAAPFLWQLTTTARTAHEQLDKE